MSVFPGMMHPPVGFGPGTQPDATEEGLEYLPMPSGMRVYEHHLPDAADGVVAAPALAVLDLALEGLRGWTTGREQRIDLDGLDDAALRVVDDALGEGEVAVMVTAHDGGPRLEIQESALAGVWRVRAVAADGSTKGSLLVSSFPKVALARAFPRVKDGVVQAAEPSAAEAVGLMNAMPVLNELFDRAAKWQPGAAPHAVNLSLLPNTPEDLALIEKRLGAGATTVLSRGYGNCRADATAVPNIWWVRYYNSVDTMILNTIEVVDVPAVLCAAGEDMADSSERLAEIITAVTPKDAA